MIKSKTLMCFLVMLCTLLKVQAAPEPEEVQGVIWGNPTNSLRAGVLVEKRTSATPLARCYVCFQNLSTNDVYVWIPQPSQRYRMALIATNNVPVPLTILGKQLGEPVDAHPRLRKKTNGYAGRMLAPRVEDSPTLPFRLSDYFKIKKPSRYRLEIEARLYVFDSNGVMSIIVFPKVVAEVVIDEIPD
jgi:hypothetical protein